MNDEVEDVEALGSSVEEYTVGYGRPPRETRWRPGQSGNPQGRPKKVRSFPDELEMELRRTLTILEGGKRVRVTKRLAVIKSMIAHSVQGRHGIAKLLISEMRLAGLTQRPPEPPEEEYDFTDEFCDQFIERLLRWKAVNAGRRERGEEA